MDPNIRVIRGPYCIYTMEIKNQLETDCKFLFIEKQYQAMIMANEFTKLCEMCLEHYNLRAISV